MKSAIITGTSRGIGMETALVFARAGYKVFATMRNPGKADELKKLIESESLSIRIIQLDVDSDESVAQAFQAIYQESTAIDVLVNNAGLGLDGSIEEMELADFRAVMETNYFGVLRCIKAVIPQMRTSQNGCIINISSCAGKIANTPLAAYSSSKHALEGISEALAQELKPYNIRVAIVQPGIINTEMAQGIKAGSKSVYPQVNRYGHLFEASLKNPVPASVVADQILELANGQSWQLRYPVGPDAVPLLGWRASLTDEQWTDWNAAPDEDWFNAVKDTFGLVIKQSSEVI